MSFVIVAPELVEAAAHDLAGIGSTLGEATSFAAAPTTSIAAAGADEVSVAIAALFGNHGEEFQALTAQAAAFHERVRGLDEVGCGCVSEHRGRQRRADAGGSRGGRAGAGSISQSVTGLEGESRLFGATVAAPYQTLFSNTAANLQILGSAISANPHPCCSRSSATRWATRRRSAPGLSTPSRTFPASWRTCRATSKPACGRFRLLTREHWRSISSTTRSATGRRSPRQWGRPPTTSPPGCMACRPASKPPSAILRRATPPVRWTL